MAAKAKPQVLWLDLSRRLAETAERPLDAVNEAQAWLASHLRRFQMQEDPITRKSVADAYDLPFYARINLDDYPIRRTDFDPAERVAAFLGTTPDRLPTLAMLLRDYLRDAIVVRSERLCPSCEQDELKVLVDIDASLHIVLACDCCPWAETRDGKHAKAPSELAIPTKAQLAAMGWVISERAP